MVMLLWVVVAFLVGVLGVAIRKWIQLEKNHQSQEMLKAKHIALETQNAMVENRLNETQIELQAYREKEVSLLGDKATLESKVTYLNEKLAAQTQEVSQLQRHFAREFETIANRVLETKSSTFAKQSQSHLDLVLKPFNEKLSEFKKKVEDTYHQEARERASLQGEIKQLFALNQTMAIEAKNLSGALKGNVKTQGNWGELILERLLEKSGLEKGREFTTQDTFHTESGNRQHPDVIIHLPDRKHIVIDSKVSLISYERYFSHDDESEKETAIKHHVSSIRQHIKQLSEKNYQHLYAINSPDFVLMFIPVEPAFGLAVQYDPGLFLHALEKNVMMVSPSTLLATLQIIANIWKQDRQNRNALEIARQGGALYDKFVSFVEELDKLGAQLNTVSRTYESAIKKMASGTGNLIGRTQKLQELGAKTSKTLPEKYADVDREETQVPIIQTQAVD